MKTTLKDVIGICVVLFMFALSDLNPLLLWEPYRHVINGMLHFTPPLLGFILFVSAAGIVGALCAESEGNFQERS